MKDHVKISLFGALAGLVTGILGSGGGMILVPVLSPLFQDEPERLFPSSVAIILPICIVSLLQTKFPDTQGLSQCLPYLLGSLLGGSAAIFFGKRISAVWLHRIFGMISLIGGFRCLFSSAF